MMKTAANATSWTRLARSVVLCSLFGLMLVGLAGCELNGDQAEEDICAFMENVAVSTEKCLANRNTNLARDTWSDLSEQGLIAIDQGADEIGQAIGRVAGTYSDLVAYCETDDREKQETFLKNFRREAEKLSQLINAEGFDTTELDERIEEICNI